MLAVASRTGAGTPSASGRTAGETAAGAPGGTGPASAAPTSAPGGRPAAPTMRLPAHLDLSGARVVDLTWTFDSTTLYWPTSPSGFELRQLAHGPTPGGYFYSANAYSAPEHGGTHLDAPIHFSAEGLTADVLPLANLIARGVVIDVTRQAAADPDYRLT